MTLTLSMAAVALLFVMFATLRGPDRCTRNCGSCSGGGCHRSKENDDV